MNFTLNEDEECSAQKFYIIHYKKCKSEFFSIKFGTDGVGTHVNIVCDKCKKQKNITDYNSW